MQSKQWIAERTAHYFVQERYNCAQSVAMAAVDALGTDPMPFAKMLNGFGAGVAGSRNVCGALTGAIAVLGAATSKGCGRTRDVEGYNVANALSAKLYAQFCDRFQTPLCCELTGVRAGDGAAQAKFLAGGGHARVCEVCVREACEMALRLIDEHAQKTHNE